MNKNLKLILKKVCAYSFIRSFAIEFRRSNSSKFLQNFSIIYQCHFLRRVV